MTTLSWKPKFWHFPEFSLNINIWNLNEINTRIFQKIRGSRDLFFRFFVAIFVYESDDVLEPRKCNLFEIHKNKVWIQPLHTPQVLLHCFLIDSSMQKFRYAAQLFDWSTQDGAGVVVGVIDFVVGFGVVVLLVCLSLFASSMVAFMQRSYFNAKLKKSHSKIK